MSGIDQCRRSFQLFKHISKLLFVVDPETAVVIDLRSFKKMIVSADDQFFLLLQLRFYTPGIFRSQKAAGGIDPKPGISEFPEFPRSVTETFFPEPAFRVVVISGDRIKRKGGVFQYLF